MYIFCIVWSIFWLLLWFTDRLDGGEVLTPWLWNVYVWRQTFLVAFVVGVPWCFYYFFWEVT